MKCRTCQHSLLMSGDPELPSREVADHLRECPTCREWQRRLLRIEGNVARIPVPPSRAKEALVRQLLEPDVVLPTPPAIVPLRRRPWGKIALGAGGLAAAVLLVVGGIFLGQLLSRALRPGTSPPVARAPEERSPPRKKAPGPVLSTEPEKKPAAEPPRPAPTLMARVLACDLKLAEAKSPRQRVEILAALADELQGETRAVAGVAGTKELQELAQLYEKVVRDGVVARALRLPAAERRQVLEPITEQLSRTRRDLRMLARAERREAAEPLRLIAAAARDGDSRLRALMEEGKP
jgi:hypothetical protein